MHQEMIEILYHTLWETVHVFFEHRELGHEVGEAGFLYPFLGTEKQGTADLLAEVARFDSDEGARRRQIARPGGARRIRTDQQHGAGHSSAPAARRQTHYLRQWRFGNGRQRLGH